MNQIVSSQVDADRLDYLMRDAHMTGATFGVNDLDLIIDRMTFQDNKICFTQHAVSLIENFLLGRYHMYDQIYDNHHSIAMEWLALRYFYRMIELYKRGYQFVDHYKLNSLFMPLIEEKPFSVYELRKITDPIFYT
jgi:HD superfamily phosphohydrolase